MGAGAGAGGDLHAVLDLGAGTGRLSAVLPCWAHCHHRRCWALSVLVGGGPGARARVRFHAGLLPAGPEHHVDFGRAKAILRGGDKQLDRM